MPKWTIDVAERHRQALVMPKWVIDVARRCEHLLVTAKLEQAPMILTRQGDTCPPHLVDPVSKRPCHVECVCNGAKEPEMAPPPSKKNLRYSTI